MIAIKICGITSLGDAEAALEAGADMIGLNFVPGRARTIQDDEAAKISSVFEEAIPIVAVFADQSVEEVEVVLQRVKPAVLQFHGLEKPSFCEQFGCKYIKAFDMSSTRNYVSTADAFQNACVHILDSGGGGTGKTFNWDKWPRSSPVPLMLAGGLNPTNVFEAIATTQPWGVDVSSGVEAGTKGVKDAALMTDFVAEVRRAEF